MQKRNPGKIIKNNGIDQWKTQVGSFDLSLDIVPINKKMAIASFVVMEQDQNFLDYCGQKLAEAIIKNISKDKKALLVTAESKGSHFVPWVWRHLNKVHSRIITLRKGKPKVYMQNPTSVSYQSITSTNQQILTLPSRDERLLNKLDFENIELVFVDDFIGQGGTIAAVNRLFTKLNLPAPRLAVVIGSDGNLFQQTFKEKNLEIKIIPAPFPLKLPIFTRPNKNSSWTVND